MQKLLCHRETWLAWGCWCMFCFANILKKALLLLFYITTSESNTSSGFKAEAERSNLDKWIECHYYYFFHSFFTYLHIYFIPLNFYLCINAIFLFTETEINLSIYLLPDQLWKELWVFLFALIHQPQHRYQIYKKDKENNIEVHVKCCLLSTDLKFIKSEVVLHGT